MVQFIITFLHRIVVSVLQSKKRSKSNNKKGVNKKSHFPQQIQTTLLTPPSPTTTTRYLPFRLQADNLRQQISGFVDQSFFWAGIISATGRCHTQHTQHFLFRFVQQTFLPGHVPAQKKRRTHRIGRRGDCSQTIQSKHQIKNIVVYMSTSLYGHFSVGTKSHNKKSTTNMYHQHR